MNDLPLTGGCNCGAVGFELTEPLVVASYCHCKRCQRRNGAAASANAHPAPGAFGIVAGEDRLRVPKPDDDGEKWFCGYCGSSLFGRNPSHADPIGIRMGASTTIRESGPAPLSLWPTPRRGSRSPATDCPATPRVATSRVDAARFAAHEKRARQPASRPRLPWTIGGHVVGPSCHLCFGRGASTGVRLRNRAVGARLSRHGP